MKISFIGLCYNQEREIVQLVKSIKYSDIPNYDYEIIIVDDGSSDNSIEVLSDLKYDNLITIPMDKNTRNQSLCRNAGIKKAKGEYLIFIDGDDYYNIVELYKLYMKIINNPDNDIYFAGVLHQNNTKISYYTGMKYENFTNPTEMMDHGVFSYVVRKELITDNDLYFDELVYNWDSEDCYFTYLILDKAEKYMFAEEKNWYYFHRYNNASNTVEKFKNKRAYIGYMFQLTSDVDERLTKDNLKKLLCFCLASEVKYCKELN